jgi:5-methylcytosine-specific restriction endonuclease McrA
MGKESSHARGYDRAWQKVRAAHMEKHPHCVFCLRDLGMTHMTVEQVILACAAKGVPEPIGNIGDHIIPHRGNDRLRLDPDNVQTLCKPHHDGEKARAETSMGFR